MLGVESIWVRFEGVRPEAPPGDTLMTFFWVASASWTPAQAGVRTMRRAMVGYLGAEQSVSLVDQENIGSFAPTTQAVLLMNGWPLHGPNHFSLPASGSAKWIRHVAAQLG